MKPINSKIYWQKRQNKSDSGNLNLQTQLVCGADVEGMAVEKVFERAASDER
ncbi:hypothetical protein DPMN_145173 [Dreissena polymorpha]|uniref:Uncharacterized protein n=1 Tax=Dreissena polymorpha TaxID=45954 RepID=A0A9D4F5I1_DREPO|nr:hypothetical protein DPMN_145173 [Dreissena polymorpha]